MRSLLYLTLVHLFVVSCSKSKVPDGVLGPEKMQAVYWDYIRADVFAKEMLSKDSLNNIDSFNIQLQQQLFEKHNITKETFYKSYEYYISHQLLMKDMLDTMQVRQQQKWLQYSDSIQIKMANDSIVLSKPD
ncbi:MAG: DUF4296 domain-containing protein [Ferruginibacter sp.]